MLALVAFMLATPSVRPELVEGRPAVGEAGRPSIGSGRTEGGSAVEAERAFAADALTIGRWAAFRKWATDDAVMFFPQPDSVQARLKDAGDPPATPRWSPTASFVSCDGTVAANTGEWHASDGAVGYFSTIWVRQADGGWMWVVDGGDRLATARPAVADPAVRSASCEQKPQGIVGKAPKDAKAGRGQSADHTLYWSWVVQPDGARNFNVLLWTGAAYERVIGDRIVPAPPPPVR